MEAFRGNACGYEALLRFLNIAFRCKGLRLQQSHSRTERVYEAYALLVTVTL
jgi:hypothetical protein